MKAKLWSHVDYARLRKTLASPVVLSPEIAATDSEDSVLQLEVMGKPRSIRWCRDLGAMGHLTANVIYAECTTENVSPLPDTALQTAKRLNIPIVLYGPAAMMIAYTLVDEEGAALEGWSMKVIHQWTRGDTALFPDYQTELKTTTHLHFQWVTLTVNDLSKPVTPFVSITTGWRFALFRGVMELVSNQVSFPTEADGARSPWIALYLCPLRPRAEFLHMIGEIVCNVSNFEVRFHHCDNTPDASLKSQLKDSIATVESEPLPCVAGELELWKAGTAITEGAVKQIRTQATAVHREEQRAQKKQEAALAKEKTKEAEKQILQFRDTHGQEAAEAHVKEKTSAYVDLLCQQSIAPPSKQNTPAKSSSQGSDAAASSSTSASPAGTKHLPAAPKPPSKRVYDPDAKKRSRSGLSKPPPGASSVMQGHLDGMSATADRNRAPTKKMRPEGAAAKSGK